jgi:hypothetical protein
MSTCARQSRIMNVFLQPFSSKSIKSGYVKLERFRKGPCNRCINRSLQCIRSQKEKDGSKVLASCHECLRARSVCAWGRYGEIMFCTINVPGPARQPFPASQGDREIGRSKVSRLKSRKQGEIKKGNLEILDAIRRLSASLQENPLMGTLMQ